MLRDTPDQNERQRRVSEVVRRRPKLYDNFKTYLEKKSVAERRSIRFGTLDLLWKKFPEELDLEGNVGNASDPGDGKVYDERSVQHVEDILKAFFDAWSEATIGTNDVTPTAPETIRKVGKIPETARICLILRGMKQERLLDCFCEKSKDDKQLPFKVEDLKNIFDQDDVVHAETFCTEQYRAVRRSWGPGEHIKVADAEPLPLEFVQEYGEGSYGSVKKKRHVFEKVEYACKQQKSLEARAHLLREIDRLKKLGHNHIVQFAKSYQRGDQYGILLTPAATTDLQKLLDRYRRNKPNYDTNADIRQRDRKVYGPVLLTAFGCLSRGLAHIHACNIRHKDIKPANILYVRALEQNPARFLWADFGLAHDFGNSGNSKTVSRNRHRYSPRYAAPEIMEEYEARKARGEIDHGSSDDDEDSDAPKHAPEGSYGAHGKPVGHGRSSDIYSFGIVFLEILSYLTLEESDLSIPRDFEDCMPFWKNIEGLKAWAHKHIQRLRPNNPLVPLFKLSLRMIAHKATDRPVISRVVNDLNEKYFCTTCLKNPEEPVSQAVIAEEQMVEGLENARRLSGYSHVVKSLEHGSVHEVEDTQQPADESEDSTRPRVSRASVYHSEKRPPRKRSSFRSPARRRDRPPSVLRFSYTEEVIPDSVDVVPTPIEEQRD